MKKFLVAALLTMTTTAFAEEAKAADAKDAKAADKSAKKGKKDDKKGEKKDDAAKPAEGGDAAKK